MSRKSWLLLGLGVLAGVGLGLVIVLGANLPARNAALSLGTKAPEFKLSGLDGKSYSLIQMRGKPVVVNFWATYCAPCKDEMPLLEKYHNLYKGQFSLVGINAQESQSQVTAFVQEMRLTFPVLLDPNGEVRDMYSVRAYPSTIFIDAEGKVSAIHIGVLNSTLLENYLKSAGMRP